MSVTFLHTADWQLGKPYEYVEDSDKRTLLQQERFDVIGRMAALVSEHRAEFVVVAGDLFDTPTASKATVSRACGLIGALGVPVYVIPGNHDHGGAGSIWEQDFFRREQQELAPNLNVLREQAPVELENAVLFPCPLMRRHESVDTSAWLRAAAALGLGPDGKVRIILAHGSVTEFGSGAGGGEGHDAVNILNLSALPEAEFDYIGLGDWHGCKKVGFKAWYSGTPELDRFIKGEGNRPGHVLVVSAARGHVPEVLEVRTNRVGWHEAPLHFTGDADLGAFEARMRELLGTRTNQDVLRLELSGQLGMGGGAALEKILESLRARVLHFAVKGGTTLAPTEAELESLACRAGDPLIARVANQLAARIKAGGPDAEVSRIALCELHSFLK
jgi:DNA repair exonuclease SbcCD nuclease subunit